MNLLITGGTGFIGRALVPALLARGHRLTVLSRRPGGRVEQASLRHVDRLEALDDIEGIINLAGENLADGRWSEARKRAFRDSRIGTTERLLTWMAGLDAPPKVLVSGSAIGWYGSRDDQRLDETAAPGEDFAARLCRDWEATAGRAVALGLRVCTLRIGVVLGADGGALGRMLPPFRLGLGGPLGDGRQWMSWVHRRDLVALLIWLLENPVCQGAYNGTAPQPVRNAEFVRALGAQLHRPALLPMPAPALRLLFGEMAGLLLGSQRVLPARAEAEGFRFQYPDLPGALRELLPA